MPSRQLETQTCSLESHGLLETHTQVAPAEVFLRASRQQENLQHPPVLLTGLRVSQKARGMLVFVEGTGHPAITDPGPSTAHSGGACGAVGTRGEGRLFPLRPTFSWCSQRQAVDEGQLRAGSPRRFCLPSVCRAEKLVQKGNRRRQSQEQEFKMLRCPCSQKQNNFK